jgi:hypothetical protein
MKWILEAALSEGIDVDLSKASERHFAVRLSSSSLYCFSLSIKDCSFSLSLNAHLSLA